MGYRALLKNYLRHLMRTAGSHFLDGAPRNGKQPGVLSQRDIAELRLLVAEADREDGRLRDELPDAPEHDWITRPRDD